MKGKNNRSLPVLWAPWRRKYILRGVKEKNCVFCTTHSQKRDKQNFIVRRRAYAFALLNLYPYNNGHLMICPNRHVGRFETLSEKELVDIMRLQNEMLALLQKRMKPHGFNVGVNLGRAAGAGVVGHLHIHVVPRWIGDTNFMPMIGKTKVISESLSSVYARLLG